MPCGTVVTGARPQSHIAALKWVTCATVMPDRPASGCSLDATYGRGDCTDADLDQYRRLVDAHSARVFGDLRALMDKARSLLREAGFRHHSISRIEDELAPYQLLPALLNESA